MGKISPVSAKYIVHASINIDGVVDRPDVIGAIFGQTEGLLGADLELRELQRSGRIGRIEVNVETRSGKTAGSIIIPSSLDKAETSIVGAALEIIQRIGPCNAKILVSNIEDVRISKRSFVIERAKELLKKMVDGIMPDSQEIADEVAHSVRVMEIQEYGKDRVPCGPAIDESDEIILVEGRADVINLLKHGIKNAIAINGTAIPPTIIELTRKKISTVFVDGDRGGDLNILELMQVAEVDFVTKAPDGKEVEELTKKEIHKALRSKMTAEQARLEFGTAEQKSNTIRKPTFQRVQTQQTPQQAQPQQPQVQANGTQMQSAARSPVQTQFVKRPIRPVSPERAAFKPMLEDLIGTRGAYILDDKLNILGKVPFSELATTIKSLQGVHALVFDGTIEKPLVVSSEKINVKFIVGMDSKVRPQETRIQLLTAAEL